MSPQATSVGENDAQVRLRSSISRRRNRGLLKLRSIKCAALAIVGGAFVALLLPRSVGAVAGAMGDEPDIAHAERVWQTISDHPLFKDRETAYSVSRHDGDLLKGGNNGTGQVQTGGDAASLASDILSGYSNRLEADYRQIDAEARLAVQRGEWANLLRRHANVHGADEYGGISGSVAGRGRRAVGEHGPTRSTRRRTPSPRRRIRESGRAAVRRQSVMLLAHA